MKKTLLILGILSFLLLPTKANAALCGEIVLDASQCSCELAEPTAYGNTWCCGPLEWCQLGTQLPTPLPTPAGTCGEQYPSATSCPSECPMTTISNFGSPPSYCCGIDTGNFAGDRCIPTAPLPLPTAVPTNAPVIPTQPAPGDFDLDSGFLHRVNPLTVTGNSLPTIFGIDLDYITGLQNENRFLTPGAFLNRALNLIIFPAAGMILFVMILWGGFEMLSGANDTKSMEAGKQRITAALIGFILLFCAYWIAQIVGVIFGVTIVG